MSFFAMISSLMMGKLVTLAITEVYHKMSTWNTKCCCFPLFDFPLTHFVFGCFSDLNRKHLSLSYLIAFSSAKRLFLFQVSSSYFKGFTSHQAQAYLLRSGLQEGGCHVFQQARRTTLATYLLSDTLFCAEKIALWQITCPAGSGLPPHHSESIFLSSANSIWERSTGDLQMKMWLSITWHIHTFFINRCP